MLQLNDTHKTHIDLTPQNLINIRYRGYLELSVCFRLQDVEVETAFTYESVEDAKADFEMLIGMVSNDPTLLTEESY